MSSLCLFGVFLCGVIMFSVVVVLCSCSGRLMSVSFLLNVFLIVFVFLMMILCVLLYLVKLCFGCVSLNRACVVKVSSFRGFCVLIVWIDR